MFGLGTWPGTPNLNTMQNLTFDNNTITNTDNSSSINSGALIIKGGLGISKNIFVGENINISNDLIIQKNTTSNKLLINDTSQFKGVMTINNNIQGEFYSLDKNSKTFNINGNSITQHILPKTDSTYDLGSSSKKFKNLYLSANSFHLGTLHIKELNDALSLPNINISNNLLVNNESQFKNKITINNNVLGEFYTIDQTKKEFNVAGNGIYENLQIKTNSNILGNVNIEDNLIVKHHTTSNKLLVNDTSQFKGIITINNNVLGEFYDFNKNNKKVNILGNVNIGDNLVITKNTTSNKLIVNDTSHLKGITTISNNVIGDFYTIDKTKKEFNVAGNGIYENIQIKTNSNILGNVNIEDNLIVKHDTTTNKLVVNDTSHLKGVTTISNNVIGDFYTIDKTKKEFNVSGNGIYENLQIKTNSNILGNVNIEDNLIVKHDTTTNKLVVNDTSHLKGVTTISNNVIGDFYTIDKTKKEFNVSGNGIYENLQIKTNSNILGNVNIEDNLIVKHDTTSNKLVVNDTSHLKGVTTISNNVIGDFYSFDKSNSTFNINGKSITQHIEPKTDSTYDLGSSTKKFKNLYLSGNSFHLGTMHIKETNDALSLPNINISNNLLVNNESQFKNKITINNNVIGEFYTIDQTKKEFNVAGNGIYENLKIKTNSNILGNVNIEDNLVVKQDTTTNKLVVYDT